MGLSRAGQVMVSAGLSLWAAVTVFMIFRLSGIPLPVFGWAINLAFAAAVFVISQAVMPRLFPDPRASGSTSPPTPSLVPTRPSAVDHKFLRQSIRVAVLNDSGDSAHRFHHHLLNLSDQPMLERRHGLFPFNGQLPNPSNLEATDSEGNRLEARLVQTGYSWEYDVRFRKPLPPGMDYAYNVAIGDVKAMFPQTDIENSYAWRPTVPVDTLEFEIEHMNNVEVLGARLVRDVANVPVGPATPGRKSVSAKAEHLSAGQYRLVWTLRPTSRPGPIAGAPPIPPTV